LTLRGRILVVLAFIISAALFAGAAVAFVMARNDDSDKKVTTLPSIHPTLVFPTDQPTAAPTESPTPAPTTPAPTVTVAPTTTPQVTPAATSSPTPRRTSTARPSPTRTLTQGLATSSELNIAKGGTTADTYVITIHATDGDGSVSLKSVSWQAGTSSATQSGTPCAATAPASCRNFTLSHKYTKAGSYLITIEVVSGKENATISYQLDVAPDPNPSPSPS
jgi:hypothetical protein